MSGAEERGMAESAASAAEVRPGVHRRTLLTFATLAQLGVSLAQQGVVVLGVFFAAAYHLSLTRMGEVVATVTLGWMCAGFLIGILVDQFGPRAVMLGGTLVMSAAAAAIGLASSFAALWGLLFVLGMAVGATPAAGSKAVMLAWPREERGLPMGVRQMGVPVGSLVASLTLPALTTALGLREIFFGFAAVLLVSGLACASVLPWHVSAPHARQAPPVRFRREASRLLIPMCVGFLLVWGQYALLSYTIPMLRGRAGITVVTAGVVLAVAQAGGALGRLVFGALSDRLGGRRDVVLCGIAVGAALLAGIVALLPPGGAPLAALLPLWLVMGATMVGWNALMLTWAGERVSVGNAATAMSLTTTGVLFGATVSVPLFGAIVEATGTYRSAWLTLAGLMSLAALLLWSETRRQHRQDTHARDEALALTR